MDLKGDIEHNKKLWTLISGTNFPLPSELVNLTLEKSKNHLFNGINHYKTPSAKSETELKKLTDQSISDLVLTLSKMMNLDALQAWDLFCYYLTEEFRGSEDDLLKFISNDTKKSQLLIDIWLFYRSERVFLLQCVKLIISYWNDEDHPYHKNYELLLSHFDKKDFKKSLISQLINVTNETPPSKDLNGSFATGNVVKRWVYSNLREQLELIQILSIYMNCYGLTCSDFHTLLKIFQNHSFGYEIANIAPLDDLHLETARMISYSINILLLGTMNFGVMLNDPESSSHPFWEDEVNVKLIDEIICQLRISEQYGPLFLGWMLVVYLHPANAQNSRYRKLGEQALQLRVFNFMEKMLSHPLFKEETVLSTVAFSAVYQLISLMTNTFERDNLGNTSDVLSLVAVLLSHPKIADCFWQDGMEEGLGALYCLAKEMFPLQFGPLVKMAQGLVSSSHSSCKRVLADLNHLRLFAEPLDNSMATYLGVDEDTAIWALNQKRQPLMHCRIVLPAGTKGYALKGPPPTVHWECCYSIWDVLYNTLKELLNQVSQGSTNVEPTTVERGVVTLKFLNKILETEYFLDEHMDSTVELVFYLVDKFSQVPNGPVSVLACCMGIFATLILTYFEDVSMKLKKTGFLPHVKNVKLDHINYINGDSFDVGILGFQLAREECVTGRFDLLKAYLQFLENIVEHSEMDPTILFGGLTFVIREVFPCYLSWHYENPLDSNFIGRKCLLIFHKILTVDLVNLETEKNLMNTVRKMCVYSLLNCDSGLTLLRIVATGDQFIQSLMEQQTSWITGQGVEFINMVQLSLSVLNRVFMLKAAIQDKKDHSLIELEIYGPPSWNNGLKLVLVVAYYIYHRFNPTLPTLAVKLLKRFAKEFPVSLLACFGMEGDVVRDTFLRRLESKVEVVDLKVAILEFITACVEKQPGLTEVFVNIQYTSTFKRYRTDDEKKSGPPGGCLNFVCSILKATQTDEQRLKGPLYNSSIDLIHALWIAQKETIITYLGNKEDFWNDLLLPLFLPPCANLRACALIFNILSLELFMKGAHISKTLDGLMKKFFGEENDHFLEWSKFIIMPLDKESSSSKKTADVISNEITLLTSWKNFITIVLNQSTKLSKHQMESTYQVIVDTFFALLDQMSDMKAIVLLSEFYLLILKVFKDKCFKSKSKAVTDLGNLLYRVSTAYEQLHPRAQDAVLATSMLSLDFLSNEVQQDDASLESLILAISNVISVESLSVLKQAADSKGTNFGHSATASVTLLHKLLHLVKKHSDWVGIFKSTKIETQLLVSSSYCLQTQSHFKYVNSVFHLFCFLVDTPVGHTLIMQNIGSYLWLPLMACKENAQENKKDWNRVYNLGIKLCAWFLHVHQNLFVNSAFDFILFNHNHLMSSLGMLRFNQYEETLDTVFETACLLDEVAKFYHTQLTEKQTMKSLIKGLIVALHASIIAVQDPKGLKTAELVVYDPDAEAKQSSERELSVEQVKTVHRLFEINSVCLHTLMRLTPSLEYLVTESHDDLSNWEPILDLTSDKAFNSLISVPSLTYGTLLSSASVYCDEISKQEKLLSKSSSDMVHYEVVCFGFELLVSFLLSQAAVIAANLNITSTEKSHLRQELGREIMERVYTAQRYVNEKSRSSGGSTPGKERTPVGPPKLFVPRRILSSTSDRSSTFSSSQDKNAPIYSTPKQKANPEIGGLHVNIGASGGSDPSVEIPDLEFYSFVMHILKSFR